MQCQKKVLRSKKCLTNFLGIPPTLEEGKMHSKKSAIQKKTTLLLVSSLAIFLFALPYLSSPVFALSSPAKANVLRNPMGAGYSTCKLDLATNGVGCSHGSATAIYATFEVPRVTCNPSEGSQVFGLFFGLMNNITAGPFADAGIVAFCSGSGPAVYQAVVSGPDTSSPFSFLYVVHQGDVISASVSNVKGEVYYSIADSTAGSISKGQISNGKAPPLGQVTAIVTVSQGPTPNPYLEHFTNIGIANCWVTIKGKTVPIGATNPEKLVLTDPTGKIVEAAPSAITNQGNDFSIIWKGN